MPHPVAWNASAVHGLLWWALNFMLYNAEKKNIYIVYILYIYIYMYYIYEPGPRFPSPPHPPPWYGPPGPGAQTGRVGVLITIATSTSSTVVLLLL